MDDNLTPLEIVGIIGIVFGCMGFTSGIFLMNLNETFCLINTILGLFIIFISVYIFNFGKED